ncbi:unnamed protein product [Moneuplotes crassus]|uniref:Uncharacterized protein n=1 Tax=Euplotes crassus TaxID=5936 RepID=A0AAD1X3A3_EUPCR|nr:unnamed protein product [Moneuplotes crassus]
MELKKFAINLELRKPGQVLNLKMLHQWLLLINRNIVILPLPLILKNRNKHFSKKWRMQRVLQENQAVIPKEKDSLKVLYEQRKANNASVNSMRGRNLSPSHQFLLESISSLDKLQESRAISPTSNQFRGENSISPEYILDSHKYTSEDEGSQDNNKKENLKIVPKPNSSLSRFQNTRFHGIQKKKHRSRKSICSQRSGIPTYFKDAAELLKSRILKQIKKHFVHLQKYSKEKRREGNDNPVVSESNEEIIRPCNESIKLYEESKHGTILELPSKAREISPTEFLTNNDDYGRLKESNESIFSFGTSRNSVTKHDQNHEFIKYSREVHSSIEEEKASKELNLKGFKDFEIHFNPSKRKEEAPSSDQQDDLHYISDGRPQSLQRNNCPKIIEGMLLKTQRMYESHKSPPESCRNKLEDASETKKFLSNELKDRKSRKIDFEHITDDEIFNIAHKDREDCNKSSPLKSTSEFAIKTNELMKDLFNSKEENKSQITNFKERIQMIKNQRQNKEDRVKINMNQEKIFEKEENFDKIVTCTSQKLVNKDTVGRDRIEEEFAKDKSDGFEELPSTILKAPFSNSIEAIQEVDESVFASDEKFNISPNWGRHKSNISTGDDQKIPFTFEELPSHRIGSGSKYRKINEFSQQTDFQIVPEERKDSSKNQNSNVQSIQTEKTVQIKTQGFQTENMLEVVSQGIQIQSCQMDEARTQTENKTHEQHLQTEYETLEKDLQTIIESREQHLQTEIETYDQDLQTEDRNLIEQDIQTEVKPLEEVDIQTDTINNTEVDVQTEIKRFCDNLIQTENPISEQIIQTQFENEPKGIQVSSEITEQIIQTLPVKELLEKECASQSTQFEEEKVCVEDMAIQTRDRPQTRDICQYVCIQKPTSSAVTQTIPEAPKRTRTGGVQVCIGNRMHLRQLKLAKIMNKLTLDTEREESRIDFLYFSSFTEWKTLYLEHKLPAPKIIDYPKCIPKLESKLSNIQRSLMSTVFSRFKNNTIKCMVFDQEKSICKQEKYAELEEAVNQLIKQNESLQNKLLYYEDLIEKKNFDIKSRKQENKEAHKKIQELKVCVEEFKNSRKSLGSQTGRGDSTNSFKSDRKNDSSNLSISNGTKKSKYFNSKKGTKQVIKKLKIVSDSQTKSLKKVKKTSSVQNLKSNAVERSPEVPSIGFDCTTSSIENGPPNIQSYNKGSGKLIKADSFQKYMTNSSRQKHSELIDTFAPEKQGEVRSDNTIEICEQKIEAVRRMNKIIKNHILMNYMIRWIENGFMHFPEGSVSPIPEKDEMLEYSAIEKEDDNFLHPITEESICDIDKELYGPDHTQNQFEKYRQDKLKKVLQICLNIDNDPEIMKLRAFKEWKRLGIKISLERLLEYRQTLDRLQTMPLSDEDYYCEEDSDLSMT